jgi:hypothetical protein
MLECSGVPFVSPIPKNPCSETVSETIETAREQLEAAGSPRHVEEVVADKGYHKAETLQQLADEQEVRTYVAEPQRTRHRHWQDKPEGQQAAGYGNRRRIRGQRGRRLGRRRSERAERTFAHVCETGGGRRTWLRGMVNVTQSYLARVAAHNLGVIMLALFGGGTPRSLPRGVGGVRRPVDRAADDRERLLHAALVGPFVDRSTPSRGDLPPGEAFSAGRELAECGFLNGLLTSLKFDVPASGASIDSG